MLAHIHFHTLTLTSAHAHARACARGRANNDNAQMSGTPVCLGQSMLTLLHTGIHLVLHVLLQDDPSDDALVEQIKNELSLPKPIMMAFEQHQSLLEERNLLERILVTELQTIQFDRNFFRKHAIAHLNDRFQHSGVERIRVSCCRLVLGRVVFANLCLCK
jgi:hypothetical protein